MSDFDDWMRLGIEKGWCGPPVCFTHDGLPTTEDEDEAGWESDDHCIHIIRPYEDAAIKAAVEANHSPSVWRNIYVPKEFETNPVSWPDDDPELREAMTRAERERTERPLVDYYWEKKNSPPDPPDYLPPEKIR